VGLLRREVGEDASSLWLSLQASRKLLATRKARAKADFIVSGTFDQTYCGCCNHRSRQQSRGARRTSSLRGRRSARIGALYSRFTRHRAAALRRLPSLRVCALRDLLPPRLLCPPDRSSAVAASAALRTGRLLWARPRLLRLLPRLPLPAPPAPRSPPARAPPRLSLRRHPRGADAFCRQSGACARGDDDGFRFGLARGTVAKRRTAGRHRGLWR